MINFRFHVVSLIAIFLALALGVVIGAGVIERGVVDLLNSRLDRVEANADRKAVENDALRADRDRDAALIQSLQDFSLGGRLNGDADAFVALRGIDEGRVAESVSAAQQAGANVNGVLWIEGKWASTQDADVKALASAVDEIGRRGSALRTAAWRKLVDRLARPSFSTTVDPNAPDLLTTLASEGFVGYDASNRNLTLASFPGRNVTFVLVVGEEADVSSDTVVMPAATAFDANSLPVVIADVYAAASKAPDRGEVFADLRASNLSRTVTTVDDLDLASGPLTATLALANLGCSPAVVGHYGYGTGTRPLPDPAQTCTGAAVPATNR